MSDERQVDPVVEQLAAIRGELNALPERIGMATDQRRRNPSQRMRDALGVMDAKEQREYHRSLMAAQKEDERARRAEFRSNIALAIAGLAALASLVALFVR